MEQETIYNRITRGRFSSYERLMAIFFGLVAVFSPLYIDKKPAIELESDEQPLNYMFSYLPFLLLVLILAIFLLDYFDQRFTRFDAYWIYRACGSSTGILIILLLLALVLKCKASA